MAMGEPGAHHAAHLNCRANTPSGKAAGKRPRRKTQLAREVQKEHNTRKLGFRVAEGMVRRRSEEARVVCVCPVARVG